MNIWIHHYHIIHRKWPASCSPNTHYRSVIIWLSFVLRAIWTVLRRRQLFLKNETLSSPPNNNEVRRIWLISRTRNDKTALGYHTRPGNNNNKSMHDDKLILINFLFKIQKGWKMIRFECRCTTTNKSL